MAFSNDDFILVMEIVRDLCHKNSVDHGFWDEGPEAFTQTGNASLGHIKPWNFGEKIALIHSELSEMFEAWRKGQGEASSEKYIEIQDPKHPEKCNCQGVRHMNNTEEEIADVIIRVLDLCGKLDIDVGRVVLAKMDYNKGREYMHGGRKC